MANTLTGSFELTGSCVLNKTQEISVTTDRITIGSNNFDQLLTELNNGTGSGQANEMWYDERTVNATTTDSLDLAGALTNGLGESVVFTKIKLMIVDVDAADGTKVLRVGPQNVANAWQGMWGGTGATVYENVYQTLFKVDKYGSWTGVTAGTGDILPIHNPGGSAVTYQILQDYRH